LLRKRMFASNGNLSPLRKLHVAQDVTIFSHVLSPPRLLGM